MTMRTTRRQPHHHHYQHQQKRQKQQHTLTWESVDPWNCWKSIVTTMCAIRVATSDNLSESLLLDNNGWPVDPKQDEKASQCFNEALEKTFQKIVARQQTKDSVVQAQTTTINRTTKRRRTSEQDDDDNNPHHDPNDQQEQLADDTTEGNFGDLFIRLLWMNTVRQL
ncbi:hypothetical protein MHU86_1507 [Fragilaria crotonensis]|nr:hypothetical protein MHU86_1507 [Fragilaria crotonensis]